jgi:FHS family L-fucose permease-like MFS transporter
MVLIADQRAHEAGTAVISDEKTSYRAALLITVSLFFLWGMANNLNDILIAQFRRAFLLTDFQSSFVQQVFYLGYFAFAIPASLVLRRYGYKPAIMIGLLMYGLGAALFFPAAEAADYSIFLLALFVIAVGLAFLETSANPLMVELGDPAHGARRLNWAQAANPLGAITGILIGRNFILPGIERDESGLSAMDATARIAFHKTEIQTVVAPYLVISAVVLLFAVAAALVTFPASRREGDEEAGTSPFLHVLRNPRLLGAVLAQFFYVGAQVGIWSYTIRYAQASVGLNERAGADALFVSLILFATGRFVGSALLARWAAAPLLVVFAAISALLAALAGAAGGMVGLVCLVATSFFMSIQFPTIFALGVQELGEQRRVGASLIIMAIIGGAALTAVMGWVSDRTNITNAMLVPAGSFLVVLVFALASHRSTRRLNGMVSL